jgi:hypothetical protein
MASSGDIDRTRRSYLAVCHENAGNKKSGIFVWNGPRLAFLQASTRATEFWFNCSISISLVDFIHSGGSNVHSFARLS